MIPDNLVQKWLQTELKRHIGQIHNPLLPFKVKFMSRLAVTIID